MAVRITCPGCRASSTVDDSQCGQTIRCPQCQKMFRIGSLPPKPAAAPPVARPAAPAPAPAPPRAAPAPAPKPPVAHAPGSPEPKPAPFPSFSLDPDPKPAEEPIVLEEADEPAPPPPKPVPRKPAVPASRDTTPDDFDLGSLTAAARGTPPRRASADEPRPAGKAAPSRPQSGGSSSTDDFDVPDSATGRR